MENIFTVNMAIPFGVRIGATGIAQLEQEIRTVLATRKGSVPLDRDFGLAWDYIDLPLAEAMQRVVGEIGSQLEKYVPRIKVRDISFITKDFGIGMVALRTSSNAAWLLPWRDIIKQSGL